MSSSRKGADINRDPRVAIHGPTFHPEEGREGEWPGEAKLAGRAIPAGAVEPAEGETHDGDAFTLDIGEVVVTHLNDAATMLVVESWTPQRGLRVVERA